MVDPNIPTTPPPRGAYVNVSNILGVSVVELDFQSVPSLPSPYFGVWMDLSDLLKFIAVFNGMI
jgi:hypothetical protein